ncbi:MAG: radical SAM protein, partial [Planctomycetota bacterium]
FKFIDNIPFGGSKKLLKDFCSRLIDLNLGLRWMFYGRVDFIDRETAGLLKAAGCCEIRFGVESGSEKVLRKIKKDITLEEIGSAFNICRDAGIDCVALFMIGFPFETPEDLNLTRKLVLDFEKKGINTIVHIVQPYPGTELIDAYHEAGLNIPGNVYGWIARNDFNFARLPPVLNLHQKLNIYRLLLEKFFYKRMLRFKKALRVKLLSSAKRQLKKYTYNFSFTENDNPEARKIVTGDLDRLVRYLARVYPNSEIGLWGSFSHGEGKIDFSKNPPVYYSDLDMVVITPSFLKFAFHKIKRERTMKDRLSVRRKNLFVELAVLWRPLLELYFPNAVPIEKLLFGRGDGKELS